MDILEIAIATVVGVGIGVLSGLLGIGGGTVMVPIFKLGFGMTAIGATATSLFAIIPTSVSGAVMHLRQKTCIPKLGILAGIAGACMSPIGVQLASMSPGWAIMLAAAIVIAYSSFTMLRKALKAPKKKAPSGKNGTKPAPEPMPDIDLGRKVYLGLPIGAVAGLVAGYVGVGGGFLMVPMFLSLLELDMKRASGSPRGDFADTVRQRGHHHCDCRGGGLDSRRCARGQGNEVHPRAWTALCICGRALRSSCPARCAGDGLVLARSSGCESAA